MRMDSPPRVLPSQINAPIRWHQLPLPAKPYGGFERSLDLYGDGKVVLVAGVTADTIAKVKAGELVASVASAASAQTPSRARPARTARRAFIERCSATGSVRCRWRDGGCAYCVGRPLLFHSGKPPRNQLILL